MKYLIQTILALAPFVAVPAWAGQALVIIDMQEYYFTHNGNQDKGDNPKKLEALLRNQRQIIRAAKDKGIPILVVEYFHHSPTIPQIRDEIKDYPKHLVVQKSSVGLFEYGNMGAEKARRQLAQWNADELIVMGANGRACVEVTINGALSMGYSVRAYTEGIADFESEDFEFPYVYASPRNAIRHKNFTALENASEIIEAMPSGTN